MPHPYQTHENTPLWRCLSEGLTELESNQDLTFTTGRPHVIGYLCERLARAGLVPEAPARPIAEPRSQHGSAPITFRPIQHHDYDQVRQLLIDTGWQHRVADRARFERMLQGADRTVVAVEGSRIIGFGRALFDGASNGYISTLAVAVDRQRRGIGRQLVQKLMDVAEPDQITWVLRAGRGSDVFWAKMGFKKSDTAMEIVRKA